MVIDKKSRRSFSACLRQKKSIEARFDWSSCKILCKNTLIVVGEIQPDKYSPTYKVQLRYRFGAEPKVYIIEPEIHMSAKNHVYKDGSLCLYYPVEQPWSDELLIAETVIPWTAEWLVYYELFLITGVWEGPEVNHRL